MTFGQHAVPTPHSPQRICTLSTRDLVDRVVQFCEVFSDTVLYTYQSLFVRRVVESVLENDGATITALWSRQSGKSSAVAVAGVGTAVLLPCLATAFPEDPRLMPYAKGFFLGIYAPIKDQATISFERMRDIVQSNKGRAILADPGIAVVVRANRGDTLSFSNGSVILARTASPETHIEGKTHHACILEETQDLLETKVTKEIRPMLSSTNGTMACIGTAGESRGGFHRSIQHNLDAHQEGGKRNHFEFPYDLVIAEKERAYERDRNPFHLRYQKFVDNEITRIGGTESDEFKMNFRCLWRDMRTIAFSKERMTLAAAPAREALVTRGGVQVAGLDVGKTNDPSVLTVLSVDREHPVINLSTLPGADEDKQIYYPKHILDWLEMEGSFEGVEGQYARLVEYLLETSVQVLVVDATALGNPVFERIEQMVGGTIVCVPFYFSLMNKGNLYKYYLQEFHAGRVSYPAGPVTRETRFEQPKFVREHLSLDKNKRGEYVVCEAPPGEHDDYPTSGALACWAEKLLDTILLPEIQVSSASPLGEGGGRRRRQRDISDEAGNEAAYFGGRATRYERSRR